MYKKKKTKPRKKYDRNRCRELERSDNRQTKKKMRLDDETERKR